MKKSEAYRQRAHEADHVLAALGLHTKAVREERKERFEEIWLPLLMKQQVIVTYFELPQRKYEIAYVENEFVQVADYYPKANKIHIRRENKWIKPGLRWIVKKFKLYE